MYSGSLIMCISYVSVMRDYVQDSTRASVCGRPGRSPGPGAPPETAHGHGFLLQASPSTVRTRSRTRKMTTSCGRRKRPSSARTYGTRRCPTTPISRYKKSVIATLLPTACSVCVSRLPNAAAALGNRVAFASTRPL